MIVCKSYNQYFCDLYKFLFLRSITPLVNAHTFSYLLVVVIFRLGSLER